MTQRRVLYPELEPFEHGMLDVGDGHLLYFEVCGNPAGKSAVFLHGGPGGGITGLHRRFFDPNAYRVVLFDQRGCGRSTPHIADPGGTSAESLATNTTPHLVSDIETLREHLRIDKWLVFGGSWGSTLALAYAQAHPDRVTELVLRGIFLLRRWEIDWFYNGGAGKLFPELWQGFLEPIAPDHREQDLVDQYYQVLTGDDRDAAIAAALAWTKWESSTSYLLPQNDEILSADDARFAHAFAMIENHYFRHGGFLSENQLLDGVSRIAHLPAVIVHGRYDIICPATNAWELHRRWPGSQLHIVPDAGHAAAEPGIVHCLIEATDNFR